MAMDRLRRVADVWNWLPAFRVVAEYESIQKAAVVLAVSASALSRTVKLLEEAVGATLFVRSATGLTLTSQGAELLTATRDAMRRMDGALDTVRGNERNDRVFAAGAYGAVLPRLLDRGVAAIAGELDGTRYRSAMVEEQRAIAELLRGNLDIALVDGAVHLELPAPLTSEALGELVFALLAPPSHAPTVAPEKEKVVRVTMPHAGPDALRAVATVPSMESAERIAEQGRFLALLPAALAPAHFTVVAPSSERLAVVAVFRTALDGDAQPLLHALLASLRAILATKE